MTKAEYLEKENDRLGNSDEMHFIRMLVDIMVDQCKTNIFRSMLSPSYRRLLPAKAVDEALVDEIIDFPPCINYDLVDDGELHILHDPETDTWIIDNTYDFLEQTEEVCDMYGMSHDTAEVAIDIALWPGPYFNEVNALLECIESGDFSALKNKLKLVKVKDYGAILRARVNESSKKTKTLKKSH